MKKMIMALALVLAATTAQAVSFNCIPGKVAVDTDGEYLVSLSSCVVNPSYYGAPLENMMFKVAAVNVDRMAGLFIHAKETGKRVWFTMDEAEITSAALGGPATINNLYVLE